MLLGLKLHYSPNVEMENELGSSAVTSLGCYVGYPPLPCPTSLRLNEYVVVERKLKPLSGRGAVCDL
jgi:hypothetical protein